jgi:hypothetical protein
MTAGAKYFQQRNQKMLGRRPVICSTQSQNLYSRDKETSREKQSRICKRLRSTGIDSKESFPLAYVARVK